MDHVAHLENDARESVESRASSSSVAALDDALERVSALDFEIPNPFVNHAPMACEALSALSLDSEIGDWVGRYERNMRQAVPPVTPNWPRGFDWNEFLGDYRLLPEWMGYFDQVIDDEGWSATVAVWVPRLMPGLVAALFHGVIRTSHAVRAIEVADTESRRAELARALGNWAVWFAPGESFDENTEFDDPQAVALRAAALGARCYVADPNIFNLHGVTGAMAVHLLAGHLSEADALTAVSQLRAEHRSLYVGVTPVAQDGEGRWNEEIVTAASRSYDSHQIKLVEACRRGFFLNGDSGFLRAAATVTSIAD
jgi:Questin oxidase-like